MVRQPVVGVMGGARVSEDVEETARRLGQAIADEGWILLNGGRDAGVMRASAEGAQRAGGLVVGILPGRDKDRRVAEGVDVPVVTGLGEARNNVNVLSSDVVVALPGGAGTLSEAALAAKTSTPLVLVDWEDEDVPRLLATYGVQASSVQESVRRIQHLLERA